jgi:60 kDa SS-A/Ro ribonucleoprotein
MEVTESYDMKTGGVANTVENNAGGQSFQVSREQMFLRFLVLGSDKPQYYVTQKESNLEHLTNILMMIEEGMGLDMVKTMINVSVNARAPKQTYTFITLALCSLNNDLVLKTAANDAVQKICRIPTHLFEYIDLREKISLKMNKTTGWGKAHRRTIGRWYNEHRGSNELELIKSCTKYANRHGYTHKDALRLCHSMPNSNPRKIIYSYLAKGFEESQKVSKKITEKSLSKESLQKIAEVLDHIIAVEEAKILKENDENKMCELILKHGLVREHVPSNLLNSKKVWIQLLENTPLTALVRSLSKIGSLGITDEEEHCLKIVDKICDKEIIERSKIHPIQLLSAHTIYSRGYGEKGSLSWNPNDKIVKALDHAFELSFKNVVPSNKRILNAIDVSGSMTVQCNGGSGMPITCHQGAAVMALMMARVEPFCHSVCFTIKPSENGYYNYGGTPDLTELPLRKETTLDEAFKMTQKNNFGMTDCAIPMIYALEKGLEIDTFIVYTDSETYYGKIHPFEALKKYRKEMNLPHSKLVVVGMQSNGFTIADPNDPGMLDVVGFDSATPEIITNFSAGKI